MTEQIAPRVAFGNALTELGRQNPRVVVLDGDLANSTRVDIFAEALPERFFEMGIAEQNMIGVAAGMATVGLIPFVASFAAFLAARDLDQIRVVVAQTKLPVKICGGYGGLLAGRTGKTHQAIEDYAIFRVMPGMVVLAPGDSVETQQAVYAAAEHPGPVYIRIARDPSPHIFDAGYHFVIGKGVVLREGTDVTLATTGVQTTRVLDAAAMLAEEGISAHVLHLPTIKPLDREAVLHAVRRTGCIVTCEDHSIIGGLGSAIAELLAEELPTVMRRVGVRDVYSESAPNDQLLEKYGLTASHVAAAAREVMTLK